MTKKPLLIMFLGVTGSGKSYFARQLAAKIGAVRLNGDSMRLALFKTPEAVEARHSDPTTNPMTFGAIDYVAGQILSAGYSVIYDAHHNRRNIRKKLEKLAEKHNAVPVVVWVKTPRGIANRRAVEREEATDSPKFDLDKVQEITMRHLANFDEPESYEKVISIDGMVPFEEQVASYNKQLKSILD